MSLRPTDESQLRNVVDLLEKDVHLGVKGLADQVNLTRTRLQRMFKQHTGVDIGEYLLKLRLRKALSLLEETELPIKEITFAVGYRHSSSFVRAFRKRYTVSPTYYRRIRGSHGMAQGKLGRNVPTKNGPVVTPV